MCTFFLLCNDQNKVTYNTFMYIMTIQQTNLNKKKIYSKKISSSHFQVNLSQWSFISNLRSFIHMPSDYKNTFSAFSHLFCFHFLNFWGILKNLLLCHIILQNDFFLLAFFNTETNESIFNLQCANTLIHHAPTFICKELIPIIPLIKTELW